MRFRKLYTFLGVLSLVGFTAWAKPSIFDNLNLGGSAIYETEEEKEEDIRDPLRIHFDNQFAGLLRQLPQSPDVSAKLFLMKRYLNDIKTFRENRPLADVASEVYMDIVTQSLEQLPKPGDFEKEQCPTYQRHLLRAYEPTAIDNGEPEDPAVIIALKILQEVCR